MTRADSAAAATAPGDPGTERSLWLAGPEDAGAIVELVHAAFAARPPVDPPATAGQETAESIRALLERGSGVTAWVGDRLAGVVLVVPGQGPRASVGTLQRVSVHPDFQGHGIAAEMVAAAHRLASDMGLASVELLAREEFPALARWWQRHGYRVVDHRDHGVILARSVPVTVEAPTPESMQQLGERLAT